MKLTKKRLIIFFTLFLIGITILITTRNKKIDHDASNTLEISEILGPDFHLGIIMDGNRRWAKKNGYPTIHGHRKGADAAKEIIEFCNNCKIKYLTLYVFSLENFSRKKEEQEDLFNLIPSTLDQWQNFLEQSNIKIKCCGDKDLFPKSSLSAIEKAEKMTKNNTGMILQLLFCYGGRQEIVSAVAKLVDHLEKQGDNPNLKEYLQNKENLEKFLRSFFWTEDIPDPQLIIRTGKRDRLSNFMTWQSIYTDLIFVDVLWPEINTELLEKCIYKYKGFEKNFGK